MIETCNNNFSSKWNHYLKCDKLPITKDSASIRSFIYQLDEENASFDKEVNWWLKCDDTSILTQEAEKLDIRRKIVGENREECLKVNFNQMFATFLKVYENLVKSIDKIKLKDSKFEDLLVVR